MFKRRGNRVSRAEIELFEELSRRHLTRGLQTQIGFTFDFERDGVFGTVVDYLYSFTDFFWCVYLDGEQVHSKEKQAEKDQLINAALRRRDYIVERFVYKAPLIQTRKHEIADAIEKVYKKAWKTLQQV